MPISCQGDQCPHVVDDLQDPIETLARARYLGWRVFDGESAGGTRLKVVWCPECFERGTPVRRQRPAQQIEGQDSLFGED